MRRAPSRRADAGGDGRIVMNGAVYFLFRRRTAILWLSPVVMLCLARPTPLSFWAGLPFVVAGELLRIWSSGYLTKLSSLVTAGPFALCRNPLYVGSFLACVGYLTMCGRADLWVVGVALFWLFHGGAVVYEERILGEKFGADYANYCRRVPRFIPRPAALVGHGYFSLRQAMLNNEYCGLASALTFSVAFAVLAFGNGSASTSWVSALLR